MSENRSDVLIVGAGPGGLALANDLAIRGIARHVIDGAVEAVRDSRAHGITGSTLVALDKLGLSERLLEAAKQPVPVLREYFNGKLVAETDFAVLPRRPYPSLLPIFQQRIVRALEAALAERGQRVEWSTRLIDLTMDERGVAAKVECNGTGSTIEAAWIVGCDGAHSTVRTALGTSFSGNSLGLHGLVTECDLDWNLSRDIWWTWHGTRGLAAAIYNDFTGQWHILAFDRSERSRPEIRKFEKIGSWLRAFSRIADVRLSNPSKSDALSPSVRIAERFITGRAILAGDAAHLFAGAAGHGIHCAVEDVLNLGWKLGLTISGAAAPSLLETYEIERRRHANEVVRKVRWVERLMRVRGAPAAALWWTIFALRRRLRSIGSLAERQVERLATDYRESPLTRADSVRFASRRRVGRHIEDGVCRAGGRPTSLFTVIRGPQADLLLFAGTSPTRQAIEMLRQIERRVSSMGSYLVTHFVFEAGADALDAGFEEHDPRVIVDSQEKLRAAFSIHDPELAYIRPDGYVGLRTRDLREETLLDYLRLIYSKELIA
jgi:2-polyprenyl-6-methoxyphenol hydroxylase-like FAD-dependent oxidoreductase